MKEEEEEKRKERKKKKKKKKKKNKAGMLDSNKPKNLQASLPPPWSWS